MSAAGMPPRRLLRPFLALGAGRLRASSRCMTIYVMPASFQELRDLSPRSGPTSSPTSSRKGSSPRSITASPSTTASAPATRCSASSCRTGASRTRPIVYLAERGQTVEPNGQSYLVLEKGSVQRQQPNSRDSSIVAFERYAIDLAGLQPGRRRRRLQAARALDRRSCCSRTRTEPTTRSRRAASGPSCTTGSRPGSIPLAMMLIAFAALGDARTTRQGRGTRDRGRGRRRRGAAHRRLRGLERGGPQRLGASSAIYGAAARWRSLIAVRRHLAGLDPRRARSARA